MTAISAPGSAPISLLVGDVVIRAAADATLREVADILTQGNMGAVVLGDDERPQALVSERDIVRAVANGLDMATTPAHEVASTELVWCDLESTVDEVASEMMESYIRHILVEEDGVLVGIVSARDLLGAYSTDAATD